MTWIGIDGEGLGRGPHRYVMICASSADGSRSDYLEDVRGLGTEQTLRWLLSWACRKHKRANEARLAGYYLSYDWTMILCDLPHRTLYRLLRPELRSLDRGEGGGFSPVRWRGYKLHYLSGMMRIAKGEQSVTVWDVGKFYQSRFVAALEQSGIAAPELIHRMKAERGAWEERDLDRMRDYCLEECRHLAMLCELLESQHAAINLHPRSWHGPGSTAGALLTHHNVRRCHAEVPPGVQHAAQCAYFGGRFEQACIGSREAVHSYDVRSAYPHAASTLPCLVHAKWKHYKRAPKDGALALVRYKVTDIGGRVWGPLPCRLADGSIVWPRGGSTGWVWSHEWDQAREHFKGVEYGKEHWELVRGCDCEPFGFLRELYQWRVSRPENKQVVKLAMNSVYGKLAQSIGGGSKWSSRVWAGIITATCRARMLELIARHGDESRLAAIATDGAYSTEALDIGSEELGGWEVGEKGFMTFVRPGIYWSHADILAWYANPGERSVADAARKAIRSRGIARSHLLEQVAKTEACIARGDQRAELGHTVQFGGARECVYLTPGGAYRRSRLYGEWYHMPATLSLAPQPKRDENWNPPMLDGVESAPYQRGALGQRLLKLIGSLLEGRLA